MKENEPAGPEEIHIHLLKVNGRSFKPEGTFLPLLPPRERAQYGSFESPDRRLEFLGSRLLLRLLLARRLKKRMSGVEIGFEAGGKPFLRGGKLQFSLSHTRGLIACSIGRGPVGVDAEKIESGPERSRPWDLIAKRFFSPVEQEYLFSRPARSRKRAFYGIFTRKEAYLKALGKGLGKHLAGFSAPLPLAALSRRGSWEFFSRTGGGYCLAHAVKNPCGHFYRYRIVEWNEKTLADALEKQETEQPAWKRKNPTTPSSLVRA